MARGNLKISNGFCNVCNKQSKMQKNSMEWGCGDLIMIMFSMGLWLILKIILEEATNQWRCSVCGTIRGRGGKPIIQPVGSLKVEPKKNKVEPKNIQLDPLIKFVDKVVSLIQKNPIDLLKIAGAVLLTGFLIYGMVSFFTKHRNDPIDISEMWEHYQILQQDGIKAKVWNEHLNKLVEVLKNIKLSDDHKVVLFAQAGRQRVTEEQIRLGKERDRKHFDLQELRARKASNERNKPKNSGWDGSVRQVKEYLRSTLTDPDSLKFESWGKVSRSHNGYMVLCKYRAKNAYGGYVKKVQMFYMDDNGKIIDVKGD